MNKALQRIYTEIPARYELINHILTFGLDIFCRRRAAQAAASGGGSFWLDVCSGTGEMAMNLYRLKNDSATVMATDFSLPMTKLAVGKSRDGKIPFIIADVAYLPFPDNSLDLITISFATRNIKQTRQGLQHHFREFHRVLKPGGRFVNLETSQPRIPILRRLMHLYVKLAVRPVGTALSGSRAGYAFLAGTIPRFHSAEELAELMQTAGYRDVRFRRLFFGMAAIHVAVK